MLLMPFIFFNIVKTHFSYTFLMYEIKLHTHTHKTKSKKHNPKQKQKSCRKQALFNENNW